MPHRPNLFDIPVDSPLSGVENRAAAVQPNATTVALHHGDGSCWYLGIALAHGALRRPVSSSGRPPTPLATQDAGRYVETEHHLNGEGDAALAMSNPVLIEVTRGPLVESFHRGSLVVVTPDGTQVAALGDISRPIFPRSAIKSLQCLPLIETGAADRYGFGTAEIALACASHTGTPRHAELAAKMLADVGLDEPALGCGAHMPLGSSAQKALIRSGQDPSQLHNNCSGKHAGMLATAMHLGEPVEGYWKPDHPVQKRVHATLCELTGLTLNRDVMGYDGCSLPNWAMPLGSLARLFARFVTKSGMGPERRRAVDRILQSCWAAPELVAGPGRADTVVMRKLPGRIFMKTGAEGVYAGGFPALGLGFALKIDDGTTRASAGAVVALIERVIPESKGLMERRTIKTWRGMEAGEIRAAPALERVLDELQAAVKVMA